MLFGCVLVGDRGHLDRIPRFALVRPSQVHLVSILRKDVCTGIAICFDSRSKGGSRLHATALFLGLLRLQISEEGISCAVEAGLEGWNGVELQLAALDQVNDCHPAGLLDVREGWAVLDDVHLRGI